MESGVYGESSSAWAHAVHGYSSATSGSTVRGVFGETASPGGSGVMGYASSTGSGSNDNCGVRGLNYSTGSGAGAFGWTLSETGFANGVFGKTQSTNAYGVYYSGGLAGTGTKSCVVKTSQGPTLLYCQESPESWFEDFGEGKLVKGRKHVELDPVFLETVTIDENNPMHVFVQLHDPACEGVAVQRHSTGFDVVELRSGKSNGGFSYRLVAKRKGFETKRLDYCASARTDSYLYPELKVKELQRLQEEMTAIREQRRRMESVKEPSGLENELASRR